MSGTSRSFITASAGTGKTYQLVKLVKEAILKDNLRPKELIATTFTCKAATELRERISAAFHEAGRHDIAAEIEQDALVSTVHGVCFRLLSRFAFEAGISPDVRVLDEAEASLLLDRAIDEVVDEATRQRIYSHGGRLDQRDHFNWTWQWRKDVREIVEKARGNDLSFDRLPAMAEASWEEMRQLLGPPTPQDLEEQVIAMLESFYEESATSATKTTAKYVEILRAFEKRCRDPQFPWSNWEKLFTERPEAALKGLAEDIAAVAARVIEHPRLHEDIKEYIRLLFEVARSAGERFQEIKRSRGVADFADLEKSTLDLLRENEGVCQALRQEIGFLLVDEFQDTSPMQLALFAKLGDLAGRSVWVGDVKQSIYGFRGADPRLVQDAVRGADPGTPLTICYRSVPGPVDFFNRFFVGPFQEHLGLPEAETTISAYREAASSDPVIEIVELSSGNLNKDRTSKRLTSAETASVMADAVSEVLGREGQTVVEKTSITESDRRGTNRPIRPGDVAVLVRRGADAERIGHQLRLRGHDVAMSGHGLMGTPEARLALACLRRWLDPSDSLAAAEIVSLEAMVSVEDWLKDRIEHVDQLEKESSSEYARPWLPAGSPALTSLHHDSLNDPLARSHSPLAAFDRAISAARVPAIVSRWGPRETRAEQRLANLEQLRVYIRSFEERAISLGVPATVNGLLAWLDDLAAKEQDSFPVNPDPEAISVGTYHSAKGLEWPVVFLCDLDSSPKSNLCSLRVVNSGDGALDINDPLKNRELRKWIYPFGKDKDLGGEHPIDAAMDSSPTGRQCAVDDENEALRLLYVGMTRARDLLILFNEKGKEAKWLALLGEDAARNIVSGDIGQPVHRWEVPLRRDASHGSAKENLDLPRVSATVSPRIHASVTPSKMPPLRGAAVVKTIRYAERLPWQGNPDERDLGDAMHRIFAAEILHPGLAREERIERAAAIFRAFALPPQQDFARVLQNIDSYRARLSQDFQFVAERVETPFSVFNALGQSISGFIDHLLTQPNGSRVIIDHKIFPGKSSDWPEKALSYSGQLAAYRDVFPGEKVETWIHFATSGVLLQVE